MKDDTDIARLSSLPGEEGGGNEEKRSREKEVSDEEDRVGKMVTEEGHSNIASGD